MTVVVSGRQSQHPEEILDWGIDWTAALTEGESITSADWILERGEESWGVEVTHLGVIGATSLCRIGVAAARRADPRWDPPGAEIVIVGRIVTGDARTITRPLRLRIARNAVSPPTRILVA